MCQRRAVLLCMYIMRCVTQAPKVEISKFFYHNFYQSVPSFSEFLYNVVKIIVE